MAQNVTDNTDQDASVAGVVTGNAAETVEETGPASVMAKVMGDAMRDQKLRQDRMRHAQEFLSSPAFLDLRDQPIVVSDDAAALAARRRDLTYRIGVLQSVLTLLTEERDLIDRSRPESEPESEPESGPESGPESEPS